MARKNESERQPSKGVDGGEGGGEVGSKRYEKTVDRASEGARDKKRVS
jgi:hypothetical protein